MMIKTKISFSITITLSDSKMDDNDSNLQGITSLQGIKPFDCDCDGSFRRSYLQLFCKRPALKHFAKFTGINARVRVSTLIKLQAVSRHLY